MDGTDVIVVGGGAAGAVIAARLTEGGRHHVRLIEAGPDYPDPDALPDDLADGTKSSLVAHDWGFKHRQARGGWPLRFPYPRGRVVGGSSAVNTCIALRGTPADYDEWADRGLSEWSWKQCLPYFAKLETDRDFGDRPWHGEDGPLSVRRHPAEERSAWQNAFLDACRTLGFPEAPDLNAPEGDGFGPFAMNQQGWRRISAAEAWLTPAVRAREGLVVEAETLVRRVLFRARHAVGVEVERDGVIEVRHADRVVLCAGAVGTPGLLLRSGVGPRDEVVRLGVPLVSGVPAVGARLCDHPGSAFFLRPRWGAPTSRHDPVILVALRTRALGDDRRGTLQVQPGSSVPLPGVALPLVSIMAMVGKPRGTSRIRFPSSDPHEAPVIESDFFSDPLDRARIIDGLRVARELSETPAMRAIAVPFWPSPRVLTDPRRLERWLPWATDSGYHPCGTVPMGADADPEAATDGRGQVRGVRGLVVADASLMPTIPTSNIHLPTLMIAARIADWL